MGSHPKGLGLSSGICLHRPTDLSVGRANPGKAREILGWLPQYAMADVVREMVDGQRAAKS